MSLAHAILGILQVEPMTGYDLKTRCFDTSIAHFWPADQAQIYRTLDKLAESGWVHSEVEIQQDRPNRKVYEITAEGRRELRRWLTTPQPIHVYREAYLIQLFFADELKNEEIIEQMEAQLADHRERLATYHAIPLPEIGEQGMDRNLSLQRLTLDLGIALEEAHIAWLERAIEIVRGL
jgi:DNA-binding PadR family transcriptional regulator